LTPKSCYRFAKPSYTFDTSAPSVVSLTVTHYQVRGTITVASPTKDLTRELRVHIETSKSKSKSIEIATQQSITDTDATYTYTAWGVLGDVLTIKPETDGRLLYYPRTLQATISKPECLSERMSCAARTTRWQCASKQVSRQSRVRVLADVWCFCL
jgi:hypothetical protein